jgi:hypothetical protein
MFRYVLNETINKTADFFKTNNNHTKNNINNQNYTVDLNNNLIFDSTNFTINSSYCSKINPVTSRNTSLLDEFDWFKPFNDLKLVSASSDFSNLNNSTTSTVIKKELDKEYYNQQILFSLNYDRLIKIYSISSPNKTFKHNITVNKSKSKSSINSSSAINKTTSSRMHTHSLNGDQLDDDLKNMLILNSDNKKTSFSMSINEIGPDFDREDEFLTETVKLFQKSYYKEPIKGEVVQVSSWRMKEKVI